MAQDYKIDQESNIIGFIYIIDYKLYIIYRKKKKKKKKRAGEKIISHNS